MPADESLTTFLDACIHYFETKRRQGEKYVYLSKENLRYISSIKSIQEQDDSPERPHENEKQRSEPVVDVSDLSLDELKTKVSSCRSCVLCEQRKQTVFGAGDPSAKLMFIGEGPGAEEDVQGIPFVGAAGQLLTKIIEAMGYSRTEVYIANIVKCRPPRNRSPHNEEARRCLPYLQRQIELIQPVVIVLLGAIPLQHLLGEKGINRFRGQWQKYRDTDCMPTFHPSYLLRIPQAKREVWQDMQAVMKRLG